MDPESTARSTRTQKDKELKESAKQDSVDRREVKRLVEMV